MDKKIYSKNWREEKIAFFDVETTGLDPSKERIVEIAIVIFDKMEPIECYCKLINPDGKKMDAKASSICGIKDEDLIGKRKFSERAKEISKILKSVDIWCAFNDQFDRSFINNEFKRCGIKIKNRPTIDPLVWSRFWWPGLRNTLDDVVQKTRVIIDPKILSKFGISKTRHRADYDSLATGYALKNMSHSMPKTLRQTLYVQDYLYRTILLNVYKNEQKYQRYLPLTMPPEHAE